MVVLSRSGHLGHPPEKQALRKASAAQAAGRDLPAAEYVDIPKLTAEQLARMVRLRDVRRKVPVAPGGSK
jgi:hypothetical protein